MEIRSPERGFSVRVADKSGRRRPAYFARAGIVEVYLHYFLGNSFLEAVFAALSPSLLEDLFRRSLAVRNGARSPLSPARTPSQMASSYHGVPYAL